MGFSAVLRRPLGGLLIVMMEIKYFASNCGSRSYHFAQLLKIFVLGNDWVAWKTLSFHAPNWFWSSWKKASFICLPVSCSVYTCSKTSLHKQRILLVTNDIKWKDSGILECRNYRRVIPQSALPRLPLHHRRGSFWESQRVLYLQSRRVSVCLSTKEDFNVRRRGSSWYRRGAHRRINPNVHCGMMRSRGCAEHEQGRRFVWADLRHLVEAVPIVLAGNTGSLVFDVRPSPVIDTKAIWIRT